MGAHAHCWATCYASSSQKLLQASEFRFRRLNRASDCCSGSSGRRRIVGSLGVGADDIAQIVHNKVLIASATSAAIGQLTKPLASAFLYRTGFDLRAAIQPGGFPSTHSFVAAATSVALERGFSDPIFGLAVVYAVIVMYDAQGVRMEVGKHAQVMNRVMLNATVNRKIDYGNRKSTAVGTGPAERTAQEEAMVGSYNSRTALASTLLRRDDLEEEEAQGEAASASIIMTSPLKERVGHTKVEVMAGALLGFITGLLV
ncbi:uncharacterized protein LOC116187021 isoform X2 [Punica granatum]|uniref:Uncharacterized protein LOC116187021 isoform X2 n=1 Tax=Punica granatum TaxID=22663 RepID=A0A6P8BMA3_PUNGR|nr:uncharacterized protein LOC116187021 isoform X2 [Punica granatum]